MDKNVTDALTHMIESQTAILRILMIMGAEQDSEMNKLAEQAVQHLEEALDAIKSH